MDKAAIQEKLSNSHNAFVDCFKSISKTEFERSQNNKWSPGQQLEHIILSVKPLRQALSLPKFLLKLLFGQANRSSLSYEEVVAKYTQKLQNGGVASGRFIPKQAHFEKKEYLTSTLLKEIVALRKKIEGFTQEQLDKFVLPHPLLGKLTLREMLYFTIYHVEHHQKSMQIDLNC